MKAGGNLWAVTCAAGTALCVVLGCAYGAEAPGTDETGAAAENTVVGRWDLLPVPAAEGSNYPSGTNHVYDAGVDDGGIIYVLANRGLYYWDGKQFAKALGAPMTAGMSMVGFFGGPDRGLYLTQKGDEAFQGKLYKLSDGEAKLVTDFYCEDYSRSACVYVSRSGRLVCWGKRFVSWYADGDWQRIETPMLLAEPMIFDTGDAVHVYANGWLLTIGADGAAKAREFNVPMVTEPNRTRVLGVLWGERTVLLARENGSDVYAFTLPEGVRVEAGRVERALQERSVQDVFRGSEGSVWLHTRGRTGGVYREEFAILMLDGTILSGDKAPALEWEGRRTLSRPRCVLAASDGTLWFAEAHGELAAYRNGTLTRFGWRAGIKTPCNWVAEGPRGEIFAGVTSGVTDALYVFRTGEKPNEIPPWAGLWREYRMTGSAITQDPDGGMWMSLADRPAPISRWHDGKWTDMPAPFDASAVSWLLPDDQGRVVVQASSGRHSFHLVDKDAATGYDQLTDAIAAAVGKGARRFFSASGYPQCLVMDDGKIWLVQTNYGGLEYYDGKRWDSFRMDSERIVRLERDTTYSVVVCMESGKRFAYDRGQFVRLPDGEPAKQEHHDGPPVFPSTRGGCWTKPSSPEPFKRSFGGTEFACDFEQTPFPRGFTPGLIVEDAGGNLWITAWGARNWRRLFVKEMSGFKLATGELPKRAAGSLVLDVKVMLDEKSQEGWRLFYRLDDGAAQGPEWRGGELGPALKIEFPDDGTYEVEVIGMDPLGGTTPESVKFTVTSAKE